MKVLALLRHAKSSWDHPELEDFDRPLAPRGVRAARTMGAELRRRGLEFDLVLASSARRVRETVRNAEPEYGMGFEPSYDREIYESSAPQLLELLRGLDGSVTRVLIIGHNPALQELAVELAEPREPLLQQIAKKFPTCAIAVLELPVSDWHEIRSGTAAIAEFITPRSVRE